MVPHLVRLQEGGRNLVHELKLLFQGELQSNHGLVPVLPAAERHACMALNKLDIGYRLTMQCSGQDSS